MKVLAPGKIILSGEHAVIYGAPALAVAVNRYAQSTVTQEASARVAFDLSNLSHKSYLSVNGLQKLKSKLKRKYHKFLRGEYTIRDVLRKPFELAQVAFGVLSEKNHLTLPHGVKIHVESNIPMNCGMGSSAAMIVSVMYATSTYLKLSLSPKELYEAALQAENMQHGQSSGLDLRLAINGGCLLMDGNILEARPLPSFPLFLVNTGASESSTGECVSHAQPFFNDASLSQAFRQVTQQMDEGFLKNDFSLVKNAIADNHRLLQKIGVVPERVSQFIADIEEINGAAKISGGGAVSGESAGFVLVLLKDDTLLKKICYKYRYELLSIEYEARGAHVI